ncbi:unnamed protein product [Calypogeia fissa]
MAKETPEPPRVILYETLAPLEEDFFQDEHIALSPPSSGYTFPDAGLQTISQNVTEVSSSTSLRASLTSSAMESVEGEVTDKSQVRVGVTSASLTQKSELRDGIDSDDKEVVETDASERVVESIQVETSGASLIRSSKDDGQDFLSLAVDDFGNESLAPDAVMAQEAIEMLSDIKASAAQEAPPWARSGNSHGSWFRSPFLQLHQEIVDFCNFVSPTEEEKELRKAAVQRVSDVITLIWPSCQVKVFGSFATGLFLPTSDCDVVILESGCQVPQDGLKAIAKALNRKHLVKNLQVIGKARVPIVKFVETESNIAFDISFDVANGPDAAEFIKDAMAALPPLKPLCLVLKIFLQQRELNEVYTGGIGSYALLVMLMSHLQMHPSRRSVNHRGESSPLESNLGILLVDFFDFYGRALNVRDVGISCRSGGRFYSKASRGFLDSGRPYLLSVEDPQSPDNDICKNSYNVTKVRSAFVLAHRLLTKLEVEGVSADVGLLGRIVRMDKILVERKSAFPELPATLNSRINLSDAGPSGSSPATFRSDPENFVSATSGGSRWRGYEDDDFPRGGGPELEPKSSRKRKHAKEREDRDRRDGDSHNSHSHHKHKRDEHEYKGESLSGKSKRSRHGKDSVDLTPVHSPLNVSRYHKQLELEQAGSSDNRIINGKVSRRKFSGMKVVEGHQDGKRTPDGKKNRWARQNRHQKDDSHEEGEIVLTDDFASFGVENDLQKEEVEFAAGNGHNNHKRWFNEGRSSKPVQSRNDRRPWNPEGEDVGTGRSVKKVVVTKPAHKKIKYL